VRDRAGPRGGGLRDGHHLRRPGAAEHAGLGRGDGMTQVADVLPHAPLQLPSRHELQDADRLAYGVPECFRYTYEAPVRDLNHRLVVVPPRRHGDQRRRLHSITVSAPDARTPHPPPASTRSPSPPPMPGPPTAGTPPATRSPDPAYRWCQTRSSSWLWQLSSGPDRAPTCSCRPPRSPTRGCSGRPG